MVRTFRGKELNFEELAASKKLHQVTTKVFGEPKLFHELMKMKSPKAKKVTEEFEIEVFNTAPDSIVTALTKGNINKIINIKRKLFSILTASC